MAAAEETRCRTAIWFTKLRSIRDKLASILNIKWPSSPLLPISSPPPSQPLQDLNPIIRIMKEQELGKVIIAMAVPAAAAVLISEKGDSLFAHFVIMCLMMGCTAIWNGILFRTTFPRPANVLEQIGISVVLLSLHAHFWSVLHKSFSWILWLSAALSLVPFIVAPIVRGQAMEATRDLVS